MGVLEEGKGNGWKEEEEAEGTEVDVLADEADTAAADGCIEAALVVAYFCRCCRLTCAGVKMACFKRLNTPLNGARLLAACILLSQADTNAKSCAAARSLGAG